MIIDFISQKQLENIYLNNNNNNNINENLGIKYKIYLNTFEVLKH